MAVSENDLVVGPITPALGVTLISLDFFFEDEADIEVYKSGSETPLVLAADYTTTGAGTDSGTVNLIVPADGVDSYSVYLVIPYARATDLQLRGQFRSEPFNTELDRVWQAIQGISTKILRSLQVSKTSETAAPVVVAAEGFLKFDENGDLETVAAITDTPVSPFMVTVLDDTTSSEARDTLEIYAVDDVRRFGASPSNSASVNRAAIQAALDTIPSTLDVSGGVFQVDATLDIKGPIKIRGDGTIEETVLLAETIKSVGFDNVHVEGLTFTGIETLILWSGGTAGYRQAFKTYVHIEDGDGCSIKNITASGKRGTARLENCTKSTISGCVTNGFLGPISTPQVDSNWYSCYVVSSGKKNVVRGNHGEDVGSVILGALDTEANAYSDNTGKECHDNMIYNSSGNYSTYSGNTVEGTVGSGIKARGTGHAVVGNTTLSCAIGITVTGNGLVPDAFGANGHGSIISGNTVLASDTQPIKVGGQDGLYCRDVIISNNTIEDHTGTGANSAINVTVERGASIIGNIIRGCTADYAIHLAGEVGNESYACKVDGNVISDCAGDGIRSVYVNNSSYSNNTFYNINNEPIELRYCDNNIVTGNQSDGSGAISVGATYTQTGNIVTNNDANLTVDEPTNLGADPVGYSSAVFTPTYETSGVDFDSVTYGTTQGFYTRIGNLVHVEGIIETSALVIGSATGGVVIGGLPYTSSNTGAGAVSAGALARVSGFADDHPSVGSVHRNADVIFLEYRDTVDGATATLVPADMGLGAGANKMIFSITYRIDE